MDRQPSRSQPKSTAQRAAALALIALAATLSMGAKKCDRDRPVDRDDGGTAAGCVQAGKHFDVGDEFPSLDGCNTCSCEEGGLIACTERGCPPPNSCGSAPCEGDEYCKPAPHATCNDLTGTCTPRPEACDAIYAPVCGCDGKTYSSDCDAAMHGVAVETEGECGGGSKPDAGAANGCKYAGKYFEPGASFPSDDGCNTCSCSEGGAVACTKRACAPQGVCGGLIGGKCADGEYCSYPADALCGAADATGKCTKIPSACTKEYNPVCGCDDKTYGNACSAAAAGVSVAKQGECDAAGGGACKLGDGEESAEFEAGEDVICADGCNRCICSKDGQWASTLALCAPLPKIELCDASEKSEGLDVTPIYRAGDALALSIQYGGGCLEHTFKLCHTGTFQESLPVQSPIRVVDTTGQPDLCDALPTVERVFDLSPLRELYEQSYPGSSTKTILLNLGREQVRYDF